MSSAPSHFRLTDIKRGIRAVEGAGKKAARVEIEGKKIIIVLSDGTEAKTAPTDNPWDGAAEALRRQ